MDSGRASGKILAVSFCIAVIAPLPALARLPGEAPIDVYLTPAEPCVDKITAAIGQAKFKIRVQAYGFTSPPILQALADAKRRGVDVAVILDGSNDRGDRDSDQDGERPDRSRYNGATYMANASIPVWIGHRPAIAPNKVVGIDGALAIGGSYNYTKAAETKNAENVTFTSSATVAGWFLANWESRRAASRAFAP